MLPFSKRKNQSDEMELGDDDLEVVEAPPPFSLGSGRARPRDRAEAATLQRSTPARNAVARTILPVSRRILAEDVEEDVAGQCLASIAAETSRDGGDPGSSSHIRAALARAPRPVETSPFISVDSERASSVSRLPSVSAPPFLRASSPALAHHDPRGGFAHERLSTEAPGVRESTPPPAFVRRSSPLLAAIPAAAPSSYVAVAAAVAATGADEKSSASSVAPVAMPMTQRPNEPTVIVVRERPRAAWIFAAAAIGALGSFAATRVLSVAAPAPAPVAAAAAPAPTVVALPAPPSTVVVAPAAPAVAAAAPVAVTAATPASIAAATSATAPLASPPPAIVRFGDDEGVAIKSPAPAVPAPVRKSPAPAVSGGAGTTTGRGAAPRIPSMGPALPDGSFGLGPSDTPTSSSGTGPALTPSAALAAAVDPPRKHALTPEQQLAAAQLKASMK